MAFEETSSHLATLLLPVALTLEVALVLATFCGKFGELEREREADCMKTFSDVFRSVLRRRASSDGESNFLFNFELISFHSFFSAVQSRFRK